MNALGILIYLLQDDYVFSDDENDSDQYLVRNFKSMCLF